MGVQELGVCEDSLFFVTMKIGNIAFTTYVHQAPKMAGFFDKGQSWNCTITRTGRHLVENSEDSMLPVVSGGWNGAGP